MRRHTKVIEIHMQRPILSYSNRYNRLMDPCNVNCRETRAMVILGILERFLLESVPDA
jgi:hypothetical protein